MPTQFQPEEFYDPMTGNNRWGWLKKLPPNEPIVLAEGANEVRCWCHYRGIKVSVRKLANGDIRVTKKT